MERDFLRWPVEAEQTGLPPEVTVLVVESLAGKQRIFVPGRRSGPLQVREFNQGMVAAAIQALMDGGWELHPERMVGVSILTEGAGAPFFEAFNQVWPNQTPGGVAHVWARRQLNNKASLGRTYAHFDARLLGLDTTLKKHPVPGAVGVMFDIGATGATQREVVPAIAGWFERLIFASPCTSLRAAAEFVKAATDASMKPEQLAVIACEGFFGLHPNGTYLSFRLPGAITSPGNLALSRAVYPHSNVCHIGAGGLATNWPKEYQEELKTDESLFGSLPAFGSLEEALERTEAQWPSDFGRLAN